MKSNLYSIATIAIALLQATTTIGWRNHVFKTSWRIKGFNTDRTISQQQEKQQQQQQQQQRRRLRLQVFCLRGGDDEIPDIDPQPYILEPPAWGTINKRALILMDVFSDYHGFYLAHRAREVYGVATIFVLSDYMKFYFLKTRPDDLDQMLMMTLPSPTQREDWRQKFADIELVGISCESDSGLGEAEQFSEQVNVKYRNTINEARRNKFHMIETVKAAGIDTVRQRLCKTVEEAKEFAQSMGVLESNPSETTENQTSNGSNGSTAGSTRVVVKPIRGVASDDVHLCDDLTDVESAFAKIHGSTVFGSPWNKHDSVLVQEFATGQEYALDIVSRDGQHKVAAVWIYDKRPANGAPFVYYATKLYDGQDKGVIIEYMTKCLDALDVRWGMTHSEVIVTPTGPRLVEVNCRQHNMDFMPLTMTGIGYNAIDMLLSAYLSQEEMSFSAKLMQEERLEWDMIPDTPSVRLNSAMVHLVNSVEGTLVKVNEDALMEIQNMDSVLDLEVYGPFLEIGNDISPTLDIRTDAGWVQLVNPDSEQFQKDFERIIELMPTLFVVNPKD